MHSSYASPTSCQRSITPPLARVFRSATAAAHPADPSAVVVESGRVGRLAIERETTCGHDCILSWPANRKETCLTISLGVDFARSVMSTQANDRALRAVSGSDRCRSPTVRGERRALCQPR